MTDTLHLLDKHLVGLDGVHFTFRFQIFFVFHEEFVNDHIYETDSLSDMHG